MMSKASKEEPLTPDAVSLASGDSNPAASLISASHIVPPLQVEHIRVRPDRIETRVRVSSKRFAFTNKQLISKILVYFPTIGMHACRNHKGRLFADVMNHTSVPHLLEHMVVDGQTRRAQTEDRIFTGTTQWSSDGPLVAQVVFSYEDDLVALEVLNQCVALLNTALESEFSTESNPDER